MITEPSAARVDHPTLTRCRHAQGDASPGACHYLHLLERVREWTQRAEQEYLDGEGRRAQIHELWVLSAELAYAHDNCPNGAHIGEALLPKGSHHLRGTLALPAAQRC